MASFEVAEQDPTPLFESQALCVIFDVNVHSLNMLSHYAYAHACALSLMMHLCEQNKLHLRRRASSAAVLLGIYNRFTSQCQSDLSTLKCLFRHTLLFLTICYAISP